MPDEVMVALTGHRISLLLDHHTGQLVQTSQPAAVIMISTVGLPVSVDLRLASVATKSDQRELESRGSLRARPLHGIGLSTTFRHAWEVSRVVESSRCPWFSTQHVTRRTLEHFLWSRQYDSDTQQTGQNSSNRVYGRAVRSHSTAWTPLTSCLPPLWTSRVTDGSDVASASSAARKLCAKGLK